MRLRSYLLCGLCAVALTAGAGLAWAQMDGPPPPDGPMQGFMHGREHSLVHFRTAFDLNHDGKITRDEMNRTDGARFAAATHGAKDMTLDQFLAMHQKDFEQHTAEMFRRLDWNGDGHLSLEEFEGPLRVRFEMMDRDGAGAESCAPNPLQRTAYRPRGGSSVGRAKFCADNDLNGDGRVTRAEFDSATAKRFATITGGAKAMSEAQFAKDALARYREIGARIFKRLDTNKDGKLSVAEFAAGDAKMFARLDRNHDGVLTPDEIAPHHPHGGHRSSPDAG